MTSKNFKRGALYHRATDYPKPQDDFVAVIIKSKGMQSYKQPISVLVVVYTHAGKFLLIERARHAGFWQSVTGSREGEESLIDCARREVFEETGINPFAGVWHDFRASIVYRIRKEWRHRYAPQVDSNTEHWFSLCLPDINTVAIRINPREHRDFAWFSGKSAASKCFSPSNQELIERIHRALPNYRGG